MLTYIIFGITYGFIAGVQPGPFQTYIISQTIKKGWKSTLPATLAPFISDGPIILLTLFILNTLPKEFLNILRLSGGIFLIYLAFNAYKSWKYFDKNNDLNEDSKSKTLFNAVIVNLLNPNPYLSWSLILGPLLLESWSLDPSYSVALLISFYSTLVFFLAITILIFAYARKLGPKISRALLGLSSIALLLFGVYQLGFSIVLYL